jgi:ligand-binding sensor domain-containing protein
MSKMILHRLCLLLLAIGLLVVNSSPVLGQNYSYINYDVKDGLPSSTVYDVIQDKDGFMWFATENGLSRYDGKRFTNYTIADGLPDNEILKLFVDSKNRVWIMPFKAEVCYWYRGKLYTRQNDSLLKRLKLKANVFSIREDKNGNLVISEHTIFHIVRTDNSIQTISTLHGRLATHISGTDENGNIKMVVGVYLNFGVLPISFYVYYPVLQKMDTLRERFWEDNRISVIAPNAFVYQQSQHLLKIKVNGIEDTLSLPRNSIRLTYFDNDTLCINSETGAILYDIKGRKSIRPLPNNTSVLSSFLDTEKNYWFATMGNGVYMVPSLDFRNQVLNSDRPAVWSLLRMKDRLYVGGERHLWSADIKDLKFSRVSFLTEGKMTESSKVNTLTDYKGTLIIGSSTGYISNNLLQREATGGSLKHASIKDNRILYASHFEAFVYNVLTNEKESVWRNRTTCGVEADSGYYIGTLDGLYFKPYGSKDSVFFGRYYGYFNNRIAAITRAPDGTILVGVKGDGIAGLRKESVIFHLTEKDGLTNNSPTVIHVAGNFIWVGTEKGLNRVENKGGQFVITPFTRSDGLPSDPINAIASSGDTIFVGSSKGLTYFLPEKISRKSDCILRFTGIYVSGKYWAYDSSNFSLAHADNNVSFNFSGISFKSAGNVTFHYRLLGLHSDWRTTQENTLNFPTLPSGNYTLQLKAVNKYDVESKTEEISFTIQKLFWEKTWFRVFAIALLAAAIWLFIRYRINKIRQKEQEKNRMNKRITELEQSALRSQMNPHFIFNSLNSIQQYVVERDISGANKFITDFSHLIRMTLDYSSKSSIRLSEEIRYIDTYLRLEKTRLEEKFDYQITIEKGIQPDEYSIPSLLLQPFVENSIRHGVKYRNDSNGLIQINISQNEKGLLITIEDNGIGRKTANRYRSEHHVQYQSKGMLLSSGRIDLLNSHGDERIDLNIIDMYDDQEKATGTRVELLLFTQKTNDN